MSHRAKQSKFGILLVASLPTDRIRGQAACEHPCKQCSQIRGAEANSFRTFFLRRTSYPLSAAIRSHSRFASNTPKTLAGSGTVPSRDYKIMLALPSKPKQVQGLSPVEAAEKC